jgi:hypothetical protein
MSQVFWCCVWYFHKLGLPTSFLLREAVERGQVRLALLACNLPKRVVTPLRRAALTCVKNMRRNLQSHPPTT